MITNVLRADPTRTTGLVIRFAREIRKHFSDLKAKIRDFIDAKDALALKTRNSFVVALQLGEITDNAPPQPRQFEFATDVNKLAGFRQWLQGEIDGGSLSLADRSGRFIDSAYRRGGINAYLASKGAGFAEEAGIGSLTQETFLRTAFSKPERVSKVQLLGSRAFEQLKGVDAQMATEMNRLLANGLANGLNPREIAKQMADRIDSLTRTRATLIARTEIINAHAEGQLDSFTDLGVRELGIKAEWSTAGDDRVCPDCAAREGETFTVEEAHGMIPLHPGCRCSWIPSEG